MAKETKNAALPQESVEQGFIQRNIKKIGIVAGAVLVVVIAILVGNSICTKRSLKAAEALAPCEQLFVAGQYEKAINGDGADILGLIAVADQYGSTKSGNLAKLYAGLAYAKLGKAAEAKEYLQKFSTKSDKMVSPAALGALGNTLIELGEKEQGAETLVKAAKMANNTVLSPVFLVQAGEVYEALGQKEKALGLYELVRSDFRASALGSEIEKYIERAK